MHKSSVVTIDVGNTHARMAFWDDAGSVFAQESFLTASILEEQNGAREAWCHHLDELRPRQAVAACVVPAARGILSIWTADSGLRLYFVDYRDTRLQADILHPERAGIDRWVNCAAAWARFSRSCLIIDMGTAVTWDVLLAPGIFAGGVIAPGLEALSSALSQRTGLPAVAPRACEDVLGRDTESALRSGAWFGFLAQVEGVAERLLKRFPQIDTVVITGGAAPFAAAHLPSSWIHLPHLTHEGLYRLANAFRTAG